MKKNNLNKNYTIKKLLIFINLLCFCTNYLYTYNPQLKISSFSTATIYNKGHQPLIVCMKTVNNSTASYSIEIIYSGDQKSNVLMIYHPIAKVWLNTSNPSYTDWRLDNALKSTDIIQVKLNKYGNLIVDFPESPAGGEYVGFRGAYNATLRRDGTFKHNCKIIQISDFLMPTELKDQFAELSKTTLPVYVLSQFYKISAENTWNAYGNGNRSKGLSMYSYSIDNGGEGIASATNNSWYIGNNLKKIYITGEDLGKKSIRAFVNNFRPNYKGIVVYVNDFEKWNHKGVMTDWVTDIQANHGHHGEIHVTVFTHLNTKGKHMSNKDQVSNSDLESGKSPDPKRKYLKLKP